MTKTIAPPAMSTAHLVEVEGTLTTIGIVALSAWNVVMVVEQLTRVSY